MNANKEIMVWDSQSADVLITRKAINKISCMIHRDPYHECGGTLIGNFSQDEKTRKYRKMSDSGLADHRICIGDLSFSHVQYGGFACDLFSYSDYCHDGGMAICRCSSASAYAADGSPGDSILA